MENNKFKYSDKFKKTLLDIDSEVSREVISKENDKSINIADLTDNKKMIKLTFEKHKQEVKFGKFVKKVIPTIDNKDLEAFVNKFKSLQFKPLFKEVKGDEIPYFYKTENYSKDYEKNSSLYESCMNNMKPSTFDIYVNNNNFRLLVLMDEYGKVLGRSIIVSDVSSTDGYEGMEVMLIPYVAYQSLTNKFKDYAESNNIFYIEDIHRLDLLTKVNTEGVKNYPYIDYFQKLINGYLCYGYMDSKQKICGIEIQDDKGYKVMELTDGNCNTVKGTGYYNSIKDFNEDKMSYTFDISKIKRCCFTKKYFLTKDLVKLDKDSLLIPTNLHRLLTLSQNNYINKELLELFNSDNFDSLEFKKDIHFYNFMYNIISKFKENVRFYAYGENTWYNFEDFNYESSISFLHSVRVTIKPKSLEFIFKINNKFYLFSFKLKPSGITLKVYNTNITDDDVTDDDGNDIMGKVLYVKMGDLIINESKPLPTFKKINEKILTYINNARRIQARIYSLGKRN